MSFRPVLPGGLYATSVVHPVQQQPMMVQVAPVRHVTVIPASSIMMRPIAANPIHTIAAPPRPQVVQTFSSLQQRSAVHAVQQHAAAQLTQKAEDAASEAAQNPPITVFVSNITERASDTLVRQMLMKCGNVFAWKRVQGASGKLQAFGFCEYKEPDAALRAMHLLHDFELGDKKLRVKVDAKTQDILNKWKEDNGMRKEGKPDLPPPDIVAVKHALDVLLKEYAVELNSAAPGELAERSKPSVPKIEEPVVRESHNVEENLKELDLEESEKDYISQEIRSFRSTQKQREEEKKREEEIKKKIERERKEEDRQREKARQKEREERDREKQRKEERNRTPQKPRSTSRHRSPPARSTLRRSRTPVRLSRTRTPPRRRSRSRSLHRTSRIRRTRSRSPRRRDDDTEDDEAHERRRMERKIREKEQAYQERLRVWELRERRKKREYDKRDEREAMMRKEMMREAKRLQEFLADYDDLKMDPKYYTGGAMSKRRREWSREQEADAKDRKKEQEEIEALRQKLVEENHPDPDSAIAKAVKETENVWQPLLKPDTPPPPPVKEPSPVKKENSSSSSSSSGSDSESDHEEGKSASASSDSADESDCGNSPRPRLVTANLVPVEDEQEDPVVTAVAPAKDEVKKEMLNSFEPVDRNGNESADESDGVIRTEVVEQQEDSPGSFENQFPSDGAPLPFAGRTEPVMQLQSAGQRKRLKVSDVFNQDDDEEEVPKKRKLVPIEYSHEERNAMRSQEDKRKMVRALIEKIPTKKEDLFDYSLDWGMIDAGLMEKRIKPWIAKKISEYIGEEEPTLVEFICSKIMSKSPPERIYEDVSMVLDDEAEVFVVKMWRLLIYETEAKKEGLSK